MDPLIKGQDSLELFDFGVLLQALSNNLKVGVLAVRSGPREKFLRLDRSNLRCVYTRKPRVSLQKVLYNHRALEKQPLRVAAQELGPQRTEEQLSEWLLERGVVTEEQIARARRYQLVEEVLELFYWTSVGFEFYADDGSWAQRVAADGIVPIGDPTTIDNVLIQCTKTIDDIAKFNSVTPSLRDVYDLQFGSLQELERAVPDPAEREFMLLIDGVRDMREVLADMRMNRFEVLELFFRFRTEGRIRPKNAFELLMLAENRRKEFTWAKRMRVLERVNELGVEGFGVVLPLAETYEALEKPGKAAEAYARHARLAAQAEQPEQALKSARRAAELMPDVADYQSLCIELLLEAGQEEEAAAAYSALGEILRGRGDLAGARDALERSVALTPDDAAVVRALGEVLVQSGDDRTAALRVRQAGDTHLAQERPDEAVACFRRTLEIRPRAWSARLRLADAHRARGRSDVAVQVVADHVEHVSTELADLGQDFQAARLRDAEERLRDLGGFASSAARHLSDAYRKIGADEDAARVLCEGAMTLLTARRPGTAVELCADLIDLCPEDLKARRLAARCHAELGDANKAMAQLRRVAGRMIGDDHWGEALEVYEEMLEIDPGSLDAHIGRARALLHGDREEEAAEHFHRAGLLHRGCGRAAEALPFFREAVEKRPGDVVLLAEYCELLLAVGDDEQETLSALSSLVELRMGQGEHALAATSLTRILAIDEAFPGAKDILQEAALELRRLADDSAEPEGDEAREVVEAAQEAAGS